MCFSELSGVHYIEVSALHFKALWERRGCSVPKAKNLEVPFLLLYCSVCVCVCKVANEHASACASKHFAPPLSPFRLRSSSFLSSAGLDDKLKVPWPSPEREREREKKKERRMEDIAD